MFSALIAYVIVPSSNKALYFFALLRRVKVFSDSEAEAVKPNPAPRDVRGWLMKKLVILSGLIKSQQNIYITRLFHFVEGLFIHGEISTS